MKIMMVASEAEPYSKTGGLGDVVGALSRHLAGLGEHVAVILPLYEATVPVLASRPQTIVSEDLSISLGAEQRHVRVVRVDEAGVSWYFIDDPDYYHRPGLYGTSDDGYVDNAQRFMTLVRGALAIAAVEFAPDILHCHDWQTGLAPVLLKTGHDPSHPPGSLPTLFTIHNLGYDGLFEKDILTKIGLSEELFHVDALEFYGKVSLLKGGILHADRISTVSEAYSREILTAEHGLGKEGITSLRKGDLVGILNGVDYTRWDPATDPLIAANYSADDLTGKRDCKLDLLRNFGLPVSAASRPLFGVVSRLAWQKGLDLAAAVTSDLVDSGGLLIVLGTGESGLEQELRTLSRRYPESVGVRIAYDEPLAHKIEAGADVFLMPSRYEPCGLNQMYSLRYGTVPVVRATGGLLDTVQPWDDKTWMGNGFRFSGDSTETLLGAIREALRLYRNSDAWTVIMRNGMTADHSWERSARRYLEVYREIIRANRVVASQPL